MLDRRIKAAWAGHPQHLVIDNTTDFAGKLARTDEAIFAAARAFFGAEEGEGLGGGKKEEGLTGGAKASDGSNGSSGHARQGGAGGAAPGRA